MKKITFILLALISGTAFAQSSVVGKAAVRAEIVSAIEIESDGIMDFGLIASTENGGKITLTPTGVLSYNGAGMEIVSNTGATPTFMVTAQYAYSITVPETVTITNENKIELELEDFKTGLASNNNVNSESFNLGATLVVGPKQPAGKYSGEVEVTISYE